MLRLVFIGDSWQGSSARSLREALLANPGVFVNDIAEDRFRAPFRGLILRLANRVLRPLQLREFDQAVRQTAGAVEPDAVVVYKGSAVRAPLIRELQEAGFPVVNVFPDYSPHAYGSDLRTAIGEYDLVISTKPFHPPMWHTVYRYTNPCVCVPHGYDPYVHLWEEPPLQPAYDVGFCASWRPEYERLLRALAQHLDTSVSVAIAGTGWPAHMAAFPAHWHCAGARMGRSYGEFLRSLRVAIAPVNREVVINGTRQPGDEDTTRTYELAAAYCFFLHQRTDYVESIYDSEEEVPLWSDALELAQLIRRWLPDEAGRRRLAARAHQRAVPAYSIPSRATSVLQHIERLVESRKTR